jgi:chromosome segregation ATPase
VKENSTQFAEIFTRLGTLEQSHAAHVSGCNERRLREEERQQHNDEKITEVRKVMSEIHANIKESNNKIDEVKLNIAEIKTKFAIIVTLGSFALSQLGNLVAAWVGK